MVKVFKWILVILEQQIAILPSTMLCEFLTISEESFIPFQKTNLTLFSVSKVNVFDPSCRLMITRKSVWRRRALYFEFIEVTILTEDLTGLTTYNLRLTYIAWVVFKTTVWDETAFHGLWLVNKVPLLSYFVRFWG